MTAPFLAGLVVGALLLSALSRKWCLPLRASAYLIGSGVVVGGMVAWLAGRWTPQPVWAFALVIFVQVATYLIILVWRFYRDPERHPPQDKRIIVSPADGTVIYIRRIRPGGLLLCEKEGAKMQLDELRDSRLALEELWQIGISMVFTDVHVNRAPIEGTIALSLHRPGKFKSLRSAEALNVNERQTVLLDNGHYQIALVQIASRLVRRIVAYVHRGELVQRGQRIGMIKFGSQVDVFLPVRVAAMLQVDVGAVVVAGESTLAVSTAGGAS